MDSDAGFLVIKSGMFNVTAILIFVFMIMMFMIQKNQTYLIERFNLLGEFFLKLLGLIGFLTIMYSDRAGAAGVDLSAAKKAIETASGEVDSMKIGLIVLFSALLTIAIVVMVFKSAAQK